MYYKNDVTADYVRSRLDYDPVTGIFIWKPVVDEMARRWSKRWNDRYAGQVAGVLRAGGAFAITLDDLKYLAHRLAWLIMTGEWPKAKIDHINRNPADNRFCNLRECTQAQNCLNKSIQKNCQSGLKGVTARLGAKKPKWRAHISINGKQTCLGSFNNPEDAAEAYRKASADLHGEFGHAPD